MFNEYNIRLCKQYIEVLVKLESALQTQQATE